jgi:RNA methyltransferase, TrmH family
MKKIISVSNQEIKNVAALSNRKGRNQQGCFKAEGLRVIETLLKSNMALIQIYCSEALLDAIKKICPEHTITLVEEAALNKISSASTPSGVVAVFKIPQSPQQEKLSSGLILYSCSDPGNMGTLMRTCAAMGKKTVVVIEGVDPWSPKVVQASAGTLGSLDIFEWSWAKLAEYKTDLKICALVVSNGKKPDEINFSDTLIMVGNEAHGIPDSIVEQSDLLLTLDMPGKTESLNAAVAGSIALYLAWHVNR